MFQKKKKQFSKTVIKSALFFLQFPFLSSFKIFLYEYFSHVFLKNNIFFIKMSFFISYIYIVSSKNVLFLCENKKYIFIKIIPKNDK